MLDILSSLAHNYRKVAQINLPRYNTYMSKYTLFLEEPAAYAQMIVDTDDIMEIEDVDGVTTVEMIDGQKYKVKNKIQDLAVAIGVS